LGKHVLSYLLSKRVLSRFKGVVCCCRCGRVLVVGDSVVSREVRAKVDANHSLFYHSGCWEDMFV
jgi:hypothetical protein